MAIQKNTAIHIRQVANGFEVVEASSSNTYVGFGKTHVFQSMKELTEFLTDHFNYRNNDIRSDA